MKIFFLGTPEFAVPSLNLLSTKYEICGVITSLDKPYGRNLKLTPPPVKTCALKLNIPVYQPEKFNTPEVLNLLKNSGADLLCVVAYGKIIGDEILSYFKDRIINVHPSLLPKYRGVAPYQWVLINGETITGVSIIYIVKKLDAGDIILQESYQIKDEDNSLTLHNILAEMGARLLCDAIELIKENKVIRKVQNEEEATYFKKIDKSMGKINWELSSKQIRNLIRGLYIDPVAYTNFNDKLIKIYEVDIAYEYFNHNKPCGSVLISDVKKGLIIACGNNEAIKIKTLQISSRNIQNWQAFLCGNKIPVNTILN